MGGSVQQPFGTQQMGGAPAFGSPPSFGARPILGGPTFGGPSVLGQPSIPSSFMFGPSQGGAGGSGGLFASTGASMPSFGSLAQQQGTGFGGQSMGTQSQQSPQFSQRRM